MSVDADAATIFAVSSGAPPAAIAVVRISGPAARDVLLRLAGRCPPPRRASRARLRAEDGSLLDDALLLWLPGPGSATGEDMAELHVHGGRATITAVLGAIGQVPGCRPADGGAFTRRALLNGRIDLAEAEGLADLLAAETELARRRAIDVLEGGLSRQVERWRERLLEIAAVIEAAIEFGETEEDAPADLPQGAIASLGAEIDEALANPPAERLRDGFRILIAGPPNAGKSTLINALAGREVAITADVAGTTRDLVEAPVVLDGTACLLIDSAGLRDADDPVERIGIARAQAALDAADLVVWLGAAGDCPDRHRSLVVQPQIDRDATIHADVDLRISATTGTGMAELRSALAQRLARLMPFPDHATMNARQRDLAKRCRGELRQAQAINDAELIAENVRAALQHIDRLLGRADVEAMLDMLFGRFCIGK